jgi:putative tricarboxylic transport membrane protein
MAESPQTPGASAPQTEPVTIDDIIEDEATPAGPATNVIAGTVPLLVGVAGIVGSVQLGIGDPTAPGSGLWPLLISVVIVGCSLALLIGGRRFWDAEAFSFSSLRVVWAAISLVAYALALPYVGFEIATLLLLFFWMKVVGGERWLISIILPIVATAVFWVLFVLLLRIPLPRLI